MDATLIKRQIDTRSVLTLTLNRPASINALNREMQDALALFVDEVRQREDVRVLVLRGAGDRGFCAGLDTKEIRAARTPTQEQRLRAAPNWIERLSLLPQPTIAVMHGYCMGAGLEMAMACDIRVCATNAVLAMPEVGLSSLPGSGGVRRLVALAGRARATDMLLSGSRLSAADAAQCGLVTRLAAPDALDAHVEELIQALLNGSFAALALAKQMLNLSGSVAEGTRVAESALISLALSAKRHGDFY